MRILGNNFRRDIGYTVYFGTKRSERSTLLLVREGLDDAEGRTVVGETSGQAPERF
ncbi:MAG: hypothetical protein K8H88_15630 [Sandaracinaceae bacterium]|nr:hypothetical protein [Sandaracinaceae bacterium]